jgi:NAD+ synthase (glutamine-hydrolysing)
VKLLKVAAGVLNQTPLDWDHNAQNIRNAIQAAREQNVQVLCLPELSICGYGCEDAFYSPGLVQMSTRVLTELLPATNGMIVSLGLPVIYRGGLFNCAALAVDGQLLGLAAKQNLAGEGLHYEPRWFKPWPNDAVGEIEIDDTAYPIGDLMFAGGDVRIGFEICEDAWVLDRPGGELAQQGADLILNPSASHFAFGKHAVRRRLVLDGSRAFHTVYVYANLLGNEAGRAVYDGDAMIASCGDLFAVGARLGYTDFEITSAVVDLDHVRMQRTRSSSFPIEVTNDVSKVVTSEFEYQEPETAATEVTRPAWELSDHIKEEEFTRAIALALFDYMRKSHSRGFVVSLSGGADSSAVATLVARMVRFAVDELGLDGVQRKLAYFPALADCQTVDEVVHKLLICVYQSTRNSSDTTRDAAQDVAEALGATFIELDVDGLVQDYIKLISEALGRELTWHEDDLALQNIQARARGPSVWLLTNLTEALLLATSNRSEAAVGYATMDGDTCGGVSPIAGIDKNFLRHWLRWMETSGPDGSGPVPELAAVNEQQPTAELRPQDSKQTDEGDLMPYDLLDAIEQAAIGDKLTPIECLQRMEHSFDYERGQLAIWVDRFFRLWCRNQWKRERYAPSFHVDDKNLDPKTWCRFPILSGGYERELREMWAWVEEQGKRQEAKGKST